ncbi:soma ferritin [Agrilus planipennis]|uniref:Ferritin n=1 Tax=Agrilus planipennis TaxID=224129 RepID=A0A7F5R2C1_AGRPL|nr:soma ferritin [Agrilus planipennis]
MSLVRQNFSKECEDGINEQINLELFASYTYMAMASYYQRSDVALLGFYNYFKHSSDEEKEHALKFIEYMNKRGGKVVLQNISAPPVQEWPTVTEAMVAALDLEKKVNEKLLTLHHIASEQNDPNFVDFLETNYLQEQVDAIKEIGDHVTNLKRVGEGLGVYMFDQKLQED